jgi:hypothetical protein
MSVQTATTANSVTTTQDAMAFYHAPGNCIFSYAVFHNGQWLTAYSGKTLEQLRKEYPEMELLSTHDALARENEGYRLPWSEIAQARYLDQLEVLPPMDWNWSNGWESFKSREMHGGDVTSIFARHEGRFFECRDLHTLSHAEITRQIETQFFARNAANSGH